jgi:hypothetical protein
MDTYQDSMKKLLTLLLISPLAFAETVNLNCSQESSYFFQDKTSMTLDGSPFVFLRIDTDKKTLRANFATSELGSYSSDIKYIEDGNSIINFNIPMYADGYESFIYDVTLNRVTGKYSIKSPIDILYGKCKAQKGIF